MKFAFHMPTYRQQDWFGQCGWFPSRSTANDLVNYGVAAIGPLHWQMWHLLLRQPILLGDDTRLLVLLRDALDKEQRENLGRRSRFRRTAEAGKPPPGSAASYAWLYAGLDGFSPYNVFHWSLGHENAVIDGHLATYRGTFVGDASGVNARLEQRSGGRIVHASCNAQRPVGANDSSIDGRSRQLAVLGPSRRGAGPHADVQRGQQRPSTSSGDRRLPGRCTA